MRDLDALEALLAAATPGPWEARRDLSGWSAWHDGLPIEVGDEGGLSEPDAALIVALRNVAPELLAVVRAAEAVRGRGLDAHGHARTDRRTLHAHCALSDALDALRAKLREVL